MIFLGANKHGWMDGNRTIFVEFDTYRNLQRHRAVLSAIARLSRITETTLTVTVTNMLYLNYHANVTRLNDIMHAVKTLAIGQWTRELGPII